MDVEDFRERMRELADRLSNSNHLGDEHQVSVRIIEMEVPRTPRVEYNVELLWRIFRDGIEGRPTASFSVDAKVETYEQALDLMGAHELTLDKYGLDCIFIQPEDFETPPVRYSKWVTPNLSQRMTT